MTEREKEKKKKMIEEIENTMRNYYPCISEMEMEILIGSIETSIDLFQVLALGKM